MRFERFNLMSVFHIRSINLICGDTPIEKTDKIDLLNFAPYGEFIYLGYGFDGNHLAFVWDEDREYKQIVAPSGEIEFMNAQDAGLAEHVAGRIRLEADMDLLSRHHARLECIKLGYGGTWNGTKWVGKVRNTNLDQPHWTVVDPEKGILTYGNLGYLERIRNPEMIPYVVAFIRNRRYK